MRRPNTKGNIIKAYIIQRHIEQSELDDVHRNNVDAVLAPCSITASGEYMERAGYPPISPDISHEDQEPIIRNREVVNVAFNPPFDSIFTGSIPIDADTRPSGYWTGPNPRSRGFSSSKRAKSGLTGPPWRWLDNVGQSPTLIRGLLSLAKAA